jgi:hypothetical protein
LSRIFVAAAGLIGRKREKRHRWNRFICAAEFSSLLEHAE